MMKSRVKTPTVFQMESTECGAASLAMILAYYGRNIPLEQLRIDTGVTRDGCNAWNILKGAERHGLESHGFRMGLDSLKEASFPCIIHWNFNHFIVLEGIRGDIVYVNDPAFGRRKLTMEDLDMSFTGVVLTFSPTDNLVKVPKKNTLHSHMKERLNRQGAAIAALVFFGLLLILPGLLIPIISQIFMDRVLVAGNISLISLLCAVLLATVLFRAGLQYYRRYLQTMLRQKVSLLSTHRLFAHMFRLPVSFFEQRSPGTLVSRNSSNDVVNEFLIGDFTQLLLDMFTAAFYLILLLRYSMLLTILGILGLALNLLATKLSARYFAAATQKTNIDSGRLDGLVYSGISIMDTIKAAGVENDYASRIIGQQARSAALEQRMGRMQTILTAGTSIVSSLFSGIMLIVGAFLAIRGDMTAGMLVAFLSLFDSFSAPVQTLIGFVQKSEQMKASLGMVEDVLNYKEDPMMEETGDKAVLTGKIIGDVEVDRITFGYDHLAEPLIRELSIRTGAGESIALVGASGSGKSTIGKIIGGLYQPWEGTVSFDRVERSRIPSNIRYASIATVSQEVTLFSGTIRENLTMWNDNILDEDMIRAAKDACIHDTIISKKGAYEYNLEENGGNFSGGQRQRLEIARALAGNPSVIIMDEATSALDPATEKEIVDNIKRRGCTCVIVAHRLSAIRDCDCIYVLDHGQIVQQGTHQELMKTEGYYRKLVQHM